MTLGELWQEFGCKRASKKSAAEAEKIFNERYQEVIRNHFPSTRVDFSKTEL